MYVKMGITMFVSLYTTRLILASLGAADFGIFTVVGGAIAMLGFLNSTMTNATQRFMSYAEGEGGIEKKRAIFNVSIVLHIGIALATVVLLFVAMYPLFHGVLNIHPDRISSAYIIYYCLIFSTVLTIINVPYDAVMTAHENMLYYSIIGIFESIIRLGIAFVCVYTAKDKLIVYGVLSACVPLITLTIMKVYCHRHYEECVIAPFRYWNKSLVKQIAGFFGWNFLTAISSLFSAQGIGIVLNHFFGTVLNAAQGIAQQVNGALAHFSGNMMKALNPVITKNAGAKNINAMNLATLAGCKYSAILTMLFGIPLSLEIHFVLTSWLIEVPDWAELFVILQLVQSVLVQMADSASTAVYAQGDIKKYAIYKSIMNAMPVVLVWFAFRMGGSPVWLYLPMIVIWALGGDVVMLYFAKQKCGLNIVNYLQTVLLPIVCTALVMFLFGILSILLLEEGFGRLIVTCISTTLGMFISAYYTISKKEKEQFVIFAKALIYQIKNI